MNPTTQQLIELREQIRSWAKYYLCEGITPTKTPDQCDTPSIGSGDGDSILFSAILYYSGEEWAGRTIEQSKDDQGGMWRSPQRLRHRVGEHGIARFSQDQMLGVLLYLVARKNIYHDPNGAREFANHWNSWMANHMSNGLFSLCNWNLTCPEDMDACVLEDVTVTLPFGKFGIKGREAMIRHVFDYLGADSPKKGRWGRRLGDDRNVGSYFEYLALVNNLSTTGNKFNYHLAQIASLILQETNDNRIIPVDSHFTNNPFVLWVNNGRRSNDRIQELTYHYCSQADASHRNGTSNHNQWTWERSDFDSDSPVYKNSFGWDCVAMLNLLINRDHSV
jgi:hypothetical protein